MVCCTNLIKNNARGLINMWNNCDLCCLPITLRLILKFLLIIGIAFVNHWKQQKYKILPKSWPCLFKDIGTKLLQILLFHYSGNAYLQWIVKFEFRLKLDSHSIFGEFWQTSTLFLNIQTFPLKKWSACEISCQHKLFFFSQKYNKH